MTSPEEIARTLENAGCVPGRVICANHMFAPVPDGSLGVIVGNDGWRLEVRFDDRPGQVWRAAFWTFGLAVNDGGVPIDPPTLPEFPEYQARLLPLRT